MDMEEPVHMVREIARQATSQTDRHTDRRTVVYSTCPPLVVEKILMVPPHCLTYQRNHRADTSWGSEVTFTFTNRVANRLAEL